MTKIISTSKHNGKRIAIIRSGNESFEVIINEKNGYTEIWKAMYKKMEFGYEEEVFPKLILKQKTKCLSNKYRTPKEMIENYMMTGLI